MTIILSNETLALVKDLSSLMNKSYSMDELIAFMASKTIDLIKKTKYKSLDSPPAQKVNLKSISASVKREVYRRDKNCAICGSTHRLNFDHRIPKALGGDHTAENIRMLCFNCNQRARIRAKL